MIECKYGHEICMQKELMYSLDCDVNNTIDCLNEDLMDLTIVCLKDNDETDRDAGIRLMQTIIANQKNRLRENIHCSVCDVCKQSIDKL